MATIYEVAKYAGVSTATVSRVLNGQNTVTFEKRIKVEEAIKKLNYVPSMLGRNLRNSESRLLLVLIPKISNPFYPEIINGIEHIAIRNNYTTLISETDSKPERENFYFDLLRKKMSDGIISMDPAVNIESLTKLAETHPIVQCSEYTVGSSIPYVTIDNEDAAYKAVKYLIKMGHSKIALINSNDKYTYARQRELGYRKALEEAGIKVNNNWIIYSQDLGFEYGQQAMKKILTLDEKPSAVFTVSDLLAIGALKEINNNGLKVPEDVALIGFDKIEFSNMTYPALTTIEQPMYTMGKTAANMLIEKIKGANVENIILGHELIIRDST